MARQMRIHTPIGDIVIEDTGDAVFPGAYLMLERNGKVFTAGLIEVADDVDNGKPMLKLHVYDADPEHCEPIHSERTEVEAIDRYIEEIFF